MPAFLRQLVFILDAQLLHGPLDGGPRPVGHHFGELNMVEIQAGGQHVFQQQFQNPSTPCSSFGEPAAETTPPLMMELPPGVRIFSSTMTDSSRFLCFIGGRKSREAAPDDDHVNRLIPFLGKAAASALQGVKAEPPAARPATAAAVAPLLFKPDG